MSLNQKYLHHSIYYTEFSTPAKFIMNLLQIHRNMEPQICQISQKVYARAIASWHSILYKIW